MRLLPVSLLLGLFSSVVIAESVEAPIGVSQTADGVPQTKEDSTEDASIPPTIFNGVEVPSLPELTGDQFNITTRDGYWLVKHYS
jgi:protein disulfide-isomerase